jgi:hypothetical protein
VAGIINGTGNFILTEMRDKGRDFDDVLAEAQALGYAEADPTFDIEGIDAAHKLCILSSIAFGIPLQFDAVYTEGIGGVSTEDVVYAGQLGYRIKHLGVARRSAQGIEMRVHPTLIPEKRLIANVDGVMNAVLVMADKLGPSLYYGAGAGADRTWRFNPIRLSIFPFCPLAKSRLPITCACGSMTARALWRRLPASWGITISRSRQSCRRNPSQALPVRRSSC